MKSINFELLRSKWPYLADLGGFAESYVHNDPSSSLVKLRSYIEEMLLWVYDAVKIDKPYQANLYDLLQDIKDRNLVAASVLDKFHFIRIYGNKAAHGQPTSADEAAQALQEAFDLARWLFIAGGQGQGKDCPAFIMPAPQADLGSALAAKEEELGRALAQLAQERTKVKRAERQVAELKAAGAAAANELQFSEEDTRKRLIDTQLAQAGWDLDNKDEVRIEVDVKHQPTPSGMGRADYVLWDDNGLPLAVIEAKKTAEDADKGKTQARCYADGLEKMTGQRPVIFYTNGFDIFIWDDHPAQGYAERKVYGFYSKDSLQYLVQRRSIKKALHDIELSRDIANRTYQLGAIRNAFNDFENKRRKALFVLATGTGKTRVAVSLSEALGRARWARRILFLCDRLELRKQAKNAFADFVREPAVEVKASTYKQRDKRLYFATYPAMLKVYQTFDVGFFDVIIADESHRSIYNVYRDIFRYFDCIQVGLTATPKHSINHNTYRLFERDDQDPTAFYPYEQGVEDHHLCPFELFTHTTKFLRDGMKYRDLTEEQRRALEEDGIEPEQLDYSQSQMDKQVYNKDTNRHILRNLMEHGLRDAAGQQPGKSIIFARNHKHAMLLLELFNELYPQYGGKFCQVIDNYDPRAEQLIDDFKDKDNPLTIAVSVDMLDTGIDVPEVVNLSFAKPVRSYVKFWQMIGRGTRLCPDLYGPGRDKEIFRIFDHWGNFEFFEENAREAEPGLKKSLMQQLFEARINLAETALNRGETDTLKAVIALLRKDIADLPETSIAVRDHWRDKRTLEQPGALDQFHPNTVQQLRTVIAPLMQWVNLHGRVDAKQFDLLMTQVQTELHAESGLLEDLRARVQNQMTRLPMHLNPVQAKAAHIQLAQSADFWEGLTFVRADELRQELRGIMKYRQTDTPPPTPTPVLDVPDTGERYQRRRTTLTAVEMEAYKRRVHAALEPLFASDPTLRKIRASQPVSEEEFKTLTSLVLTSHPDVDLSLLREFYPAAAPLEIVLRSIVGMDMDVVEQHFSDFVSRHHLEPTQSHFLMTLKRLISHNGAIKVTQLYDAPFTSLHSDGLDGVFHDDDVVDELLDLIKIFDPETYGASEPV